MLLLPFHSSWYPQDICIGPTWAHADVRPVTIARDGTHRMARSEHLSTSGTRSVWPAPLNHMQKVLAQDTRQ